jgi:chromosome segregation ATPase
MPKQTPKVGLKESFLKDVEKAFDTLEKAGQKVTVQAIHDKTGGSMNKVCLAVRIVRERRETKRREAESVPDMPAEVREAFEAAWVQTYRVADASAADARKSFADEIAKKNAEIEEREAVIGDLEAKKAALESELKAAKEAEYEAQLSMTKLEGTVGQYERDLQIANGKLEERDIILRAFVTSPR